MRVYLTTNSPGEVATWVRPVVDELERTRRSTGRPCEVYVFITPCRYASGEEADVLASMPQVARIFGTRETARYAVTGRAPRGFRHEGPGVLLFLGGEIKLAAWLARRLGVPAALYTEGFVNTARAFRRIYVPYRRAKDRALRHGAREEQVRVVGNLMVDSVQPYVTTKEKAREALGLAPEGPVVAVLPGSRRFEWEVLVPFYSQTVRELRRKLPGLEAVLAISPFSEALKDAYGLHVAPGTWVRAEVEGEQVIAASHLSQIAIQAADLVLTLPGSNTLEAAALRRAAVVSLPLFKPEDVPLDGLAGMIGNIPLIGSALKRFVVLQYARRVPFTALPNRIAGKEIVPELKGRSLQPWEVTSVALELLMDDHVRERIAKESHSAVGEAGAARTIVADILRLAAE